jgi:hypothetical protein
MTYDGRLSRYATSRSGREYEEAAGLPRLHWMLDVEPSEIFLFLTLGV